MKYRDIAKQMIWDRGFKTEAVAEDGNTYHDLKKPFAAGQLDKVNAAIDTYRQQIGKKWGMIEKPSKGKKK